VLFDWDGTIVDSAEASFRCYVRLFESYRIPFDRDRFQSTYSPDWYRTYAALGLPKECWDEADERWLGFYAGEENVMLGGARAADVYVVGVPGPFPNREELKASAPDLVCDSLASAVAALVVIEQGGTA